MLEFDAQSHSYSINGRRVPGVTEILKPLYGDLRFVSEDLLEYKSQLGQAVHRAVELHALDGLDYASLSGPVMAMFDQYLLFEAETGFRPEAAEVRVASALGYAGTYDLLGTLRGSRWLVDIKTTCVISPAVKLQTAAYQKAHNESSALTAQYRAALRLAVDKHVWHPFKNDTQDLSAFVGFLNVHRWCQSHNKAIEV